MKFADPSPETAPTKDIHVGLEDELISNDCIAWPEPHDFEGYAKETPTAPVMGLAVTPPLPETLVTPPPTPV
jgi:hypothetical protein